ncbi:MAG: hypothetical protein K9G48_12755 [Reyranella sp.]|nr:hypothetical protein [Reyranella sp.]
MKRKKDGWPPLTSAKKAIPQAREIERAIAEQDSRLRPAPASAGSGDVAAESAGA